jgi:transposase InsO family protein
MTKEELESGLKKYEIIAPLLNNDLEAGEKRKMRNEIMIKHNISERTLRRYVYKYSKHGYEGLITQHRKDKGKSKTISKTILEKAIELREEMPQRSVRNIIKILESEGEIEPDTMPKSTLSRQLLQNGYGAKDAKSQEESVHGSKRFQRVGRNSLWQSDIKYGPYIPGKNGKKIRTYILCLIDDATRLVVHGEIYDNQRLPILEDCFRKAILKFGIPQSVYVDNGKIFVSKWFRLACARIGIKHINTKPYSPASKGYVKKSVMLRNTI